MLAALISIKRGAAIASSAGIVRCLLSHPAAVGSILCSNRREQLLHKSQVVEPNQMCAFKVDTLPMVRRMEAQSKLQSELKSDQVKLQSELKSDQVKKMHNGFWVDIHADRLVCIATTLVAVYILGFGVFDPQMQHKKS